MTILKYSLDFVNEGKEFKITNWTIEKHTSALDRLAQLIKEKGEMSNKDSDIWFKRYVVYEALLEIDEDVKIEKIIDMHPLDFLQLFSDVYNAGRKGIYHINPPKATSKKQKK